MCAGHPVPQRASTWTYPDGGVDKGTCTVVVVMVVFRDDLRVHKHAAFTHAIKEAAIVRRCFCSTRGSSGSRRLSSSAQASTAPSFLWKACVRAYAAHSAGGGGMLFRVGVAEKDGGECVAANGHQARVCTQGDQRRRVGGRAKAAGTVILPCNAPRTCKRDDA